MRPTRRSRTYALGAASAAAHVAVFAALAIYVPRIGLQLHEGGPRIVVAPVVLLPRPDRATPSQPLAAAPVRLHRPAAPSAPDLPVAPLFTPESALQLPDAAATQASTVRASLRRWVGCANPDAVSLSREERDACVERFAANDESAAPIGLGLSSRRQRALDAANAHKDACRAYRAGGEQPPLVTGLC